MKTLLISLAVVAALSGAASASERNYDLRESDTYFGKFSQQLRNGHKAYTTVDALAAAQEGRTLTNFERLMKISAENESGRK
ncbi:MAG: hypothetical protein WCE69_09350 [Aestuariivirga sp.]